MGLSRLRMDVRPYGSFGRITRGWLASFGQIARGWLVPFGAGLCADV